MSGHMCNCHIDSSDRDGDDDDGEETVMIRAVENAVSSAQMRLLPELYNLELRF